MYIILTAFKYYYQSIMLYFEEEIMGAIERKNDTENTILKNDDTNTTPAPTLYSESKVSI